MKSYNNLWPELVSFKNIYLAYKRARESKPTREKVLFFGLNIEKEIFSIQSDLIDNKYIISKYKKFKVYEPKERIISAPTFRDVVVQHSLINIINPIFEKSFIFNSFACRKGKGTHKGMFRIKKVIHSFNCPIYYLKCDIKKYFPSINKVILKKIISNKIIDKKILNLIYNIIDSYSSDFGINKGIPIGNLTSQLFANIYLNELDQFVKHKLKIKSYFRYVDDFIILSNSKRQLHLFEYKIKMFLKKNLDLSMPKHKTYINLINNGVDFIGYKIFPSKIKIRNSNLKRFIKRTKNNVVLYNSHKLNHINLESSICSFLGYTKHADAYFITEKQFNNYFSNWKYLFYKIY